MTDYMAVDQFGQTFHALGKYPRKALMDRLGYSRAERIYADNSEGKSLHVGWKVGPHWCNVYIVTPMAKETSQ